MTKTIPPKKLPQEAPENDPTQKPAYDPTEARIVRCKPIVEKIIKEMLNEELLLADQAYIEQEFIRQIEMVFKNVVIDHANMIFKLMRDSISIALQQEAKKHWGKDPNDVTLKDLEDKLSQDDSGQNVNKTESK